MNKDIIHLRASVPAKYREANLLKNAAFSDGDKDWILQNVTINAREGTNRAEFTNRPEDAYVFQTVGPQMDLCGRYLVAFEIGTWQRKANNASLMAGVSMIEGAPILKGVPMLAGDYNSYKEFQITGVSSRPQLVFFELNLTPESRPLPLEFFVIGVTGEFWIDNLVFAKIDDTVEPEPGEELITNGDFEKGDDSWQFTNTDIIDVDDSLKALMHLEASIEQTIDQTLHPLRAGTYVLQFHLQASDDVKDRDGRIEVLCDGQPRPNPQTFILDAPHSRHMVFVFTLTDADIKDHVVGVRIVKVRGTDGDPHILGWRIDNVSLKEIEPSEA